MSRRRLARTFVPLLAIAASFPARIQGAVDTNPARGPIPAGCDTLDGAEALDFWVGSWTVHMADRQVGTNRIEKILGGCALEEHWLDAAGREGRSLFYFVSARGEWRQVWVTASPDQPGAVKEKRMVERPPEGGVRFQGEVLLDDGRSYLDRTTLSPVAGGRVRQHIEISTDGGSAWRTTFDAEYVPAPPPDSPALQSMQGASVQERSASFEGDLPRSAALRFGTEPLGSGGLYDAPRLGVRSVEEGSPAARAGLAPGDAIEAVNGRTATSALEAAELLENLPGEREAILEVRRDGSVRTLRFTPASEPLEGLLGVHTTYGVLHMEDGTPLRTLLTRPLDTEGRLPAILLADWTSCDSAEVPRPLHRGWIDLVRGVVETTGMMVLRVDKPGTGDSLGSCADLDFDQTVAYQRKALRWLKGHSGVDSTRVFVFGESVGSFMAPLIALNEDVAGVFVYGGGAQTWFERMLAFERRQRELAGRPPEETDQAMKRLTTFFHAYLVEGRPLEEIFAGDERMREVWARDVSHNSNSRHYGRPVAFHQQAQRHDFARTWADVGAPTLVLFGEFDQFETEEGARAIVSAVNSASPGNGTMIVYPRMNHQLELYPTREAAFEGSLEPIVGAELVLSDIRAWLDRIAAARGASPAPEDGDE